MSNKSKGAAKHVRHGKACIIKVQYEGSLEDCSAFQEAGIKEHARRNCWTSLAKDKAQINTPVNYEILSDEQVYQLCGR